MVGHSPRKPSTPNIDMEMTISDSSFEDDSDEEGTEYSDGEDKELSEDDGSEENEGYDTPNEEEIVSTKEFLKNASPSPTNLIMMPGRQCENGIDPTLAPFIRQWKYGGEIGPDCDLCGKVICPDDERCDIDGTLYTLIWEADIKEKEMCINVLDLDVGILQCGYCFNLFHRFNCVLSMTKSSYLNSRRTGLWSCPSCVPQFVSTKFERDRVIIQDWNLLYIFQRVLGMLQKYDPLYNMLPCIISRHRIKGNNLNSLYEIG